MSNDIITFLHLIITLSFVQFSANVYENSNNKGMIH